MNYSLVWAVHKWYHHPLWGNGWQGEGRRHFRIWDWDVYWAQIGKIVLQGKRPQRQRFWTVFFTLQIQSIWPHAKKNQANIFTNFRKLTATIRTTILPFLKVRYANLILSKNSIYYVTNFLISLWIVYCTILCKV